MISTKERGRNKKTNEDMKKIKRRKDDNWFTIDYTVSFTLLKHSKYTVNIFPLNKL